MRQHQRLTAFTLLAIFWNPFPAIGQVNITWTGLGDGSTFSDNSNWFAEDGAGSGVAGPGFIAPYIVGNSLKFDTSPGVAIDNDLDFLNDNGGLPLELGLGFGGTALDSGAFHFQAGSGDFTITGGEVQIGSTSGLTAIRADVGAGTTQTFNLPISLGGDAGNDNFQIRMANTVFDGDLPSTYGTVVFNGDISFNNDRLFIEEAAARIVLNGNNIGGGARTMGGKAQTNNTTNFARSVLINRAAGFGSEIVLGSNTALGDPTTGSWADGTLDLRGLNTSSGAFLNTTAPLDLSAYHLQLQSGNGAVQGSINYRSEHDSSIGYVTSARGNRWLRATGNGNLTIAHGLFATDGDVARIAILQPSGAIGGGQIIVDGTLHTSFIDPLSATGTDKDGLQINDGIDNSSRGGIAIGQQATAQDGATLINGTLQVRTGIVTLTGDSSTTWIGSEIRTLTDGTIIAGNDNAFGDSNSLIATDTGTVVDIGTHTIGQRFSKAEGTLRGTGTLTNEADWSIAGTVQPGGETPASTDTLTFDFSNAAVGNTLTFESTSTVDFVLDAGLSSSTIDVLGPSLGGTTSVLLNDNTFNFNDLTAGSLTEGAYTLFDGDANTSFTLGAVAITGLTGFANSTLSVVDDDIILNLSAGADPLLGDFNADGVVDAADYTVWRDNVGQPDGVLNGNGSGGGTVIGLDYDLWVSNYGASSGTSTALAVPEPGTLLMTMPIALGGCRRRRC